MPEVHPLGVTPPPAGNELHEVEKTWRSPRWARRISRWPWKHPGKVAAALALLLVSGVFLLHQLLSPIYFARVVIELRGIESDSHDFNSATRELPRAYVKEQLERLGSKALLDQAKKYLRTEGRPGDRRDLTGKRVTPLVREARRLGKSRSSTVELGVYCNNAKDAADMANVIAFFYKEEREAASNEHIDREFKKVAAAASGHRDRTEKMAKELEEMQIRLGISDPNIEKFDAPVSGAGGSADLERYHFAKSQYLDARREYKAAYFKFRTEELERGHPPSPAAIREIAEPAAKPLLPSYRRFKYALPS